MRIYNKGDNDDRHPLASIRVCYSRSRNDKEWPSRWMQVPYVCHKTGVFKVRYYQNHMLLFCKKGDSSGEQAFYLVNPDHVSILDFMEWIE